MSKCLISNKTPSSLLLAGLEMLAAAPATAVRQAERSSWERPVNTPSSQLRYSLLRVERHLLTGGNHIPCRSAGLMEAPPAQAVSMLVSDTAMEPDCCLLSFLMLA